MKNGSPETYGQKRDANQPDSIKKFWTRLTTRGTISTRLARALNLKEPPGEPPFADMSELKIVTDMMQGGFSAYSLFSHRVSSSPGSSSPAGKLVIGGPIIAPSDDLDPRLAELLVPAALIPETMSRPFFKNDVLDCRIGNAMIDYFPEPAQRNPNTDTNPQSLRVMFILNGSPVFIQTQNNLVSSAADYDFIFQTADSYWNGIVPAGSYFSWLMVKSNGATGATKAFDAGDIFGLSLSGLSVPAGTRLPGQ